MHDQVSSADIIKLMKHEHKYYCPQFSDVKQTLRDIGPTDSILLFIGAGDIDNLAREMTK